jgi:probable F420-dependent oxidoreductase
MRFGVNLHNYGSLGHREELMKAVDAAEELGFDSVWVTDHILMPKSLPDPYGSIIEAMTTMAFVAGRSTRLRLGTSVVVLPQRNPILLAKQAAAIHELSGGRFTLGVGIGWVKEEYEMLGAPWVNRGETADEFIAVMQELWTNPEPKFDGERVKFSDALFAPSPGKHLPLVVGGGSDAALRRAARFGAGWHAIHSEPAEIRAARARLDELSGAKDLEIQLRLAVRMNDVALPKWHCLAGDPGVVRAAVDEYRKAGVDLLIADFGEQPIEGFLGQMRTFAAEVAKLDGAVTTS